MFFGYNDRFWSKTSGALLRKVTTQSSRVTSVVEAGKSDVSVKFVILMVFSFLPRRCHPLTSCIKRITHQPYYNVIFFEKDRRQILKKGYALCLPLIKKCCQIATFPASYFESCSNSECKLFFLLLTM